MRRFFLALAIAAPTLAIAQDHDHADGGKLGRVVFPSTCKASVRPQIERAVAMLHSFWFDASTTAFTDIAQADSTCALAYWGGAITIMGNPMTRVAPNAQRAQRGLELAQRAVALAAKQSHREQMYAATAIAYYTDYATKDHASRMKAQELAWDAIRKAHPEDMEATIFYARTLVANASPTDMTFAQQIAAAELMQPLFDKHPDHPGLAHYIIHAYDAPATAAFGSRAAKAYADIAPAAPHALHMPSHIFTRLGQWDESIETNQRSARAEPDSNAAVHPMDYMVYAYLQQGREREAKGVIDRAMLKADQFYGGTLNYNFIAMPARFALERDAWAEAAKLRQGAGGQANVRALTHFARAIGNARAGGLVEANDALDSLKADKAQLDAANDKYWSTIVESQLFAATAVVKLSSRSSSDTAGALEQARLGAELEETVEKHPVTPGPLMPAREVQADLFFQLGQYREAFAAYEKTLKREPRRFRALRGAACSAEAAGNKVGAAEYFRQIGELRAKGDAVRDRAPAARDICTRR